MRLMGLDYGSRTVGVAVSDGLGLTAQAVETITREKENHLRRTFARIEELIAEYNTGLIILGLPLNMDGSEGERAEKTLEFKDALEKRMGLKVVMQDERLTTEAAKEILEEAGVRASDMKQYIDKIAAAIILQDYMDNRYERE